MSAENPTEMDILDAMFGTVKTYNQLAQMQLDQVQVAKDDNDPLAVIKAQDEVIDTLIKSNKKWAEITDQISQMVKKLQN